MSIDPNFLDKARSTEVHDEEFARLLAASIEAFTKYTNTLSDIERQLAGQVNTDGVPEKFRTWIFYRVGFRALASTQGLKHLLMQQGWQPVPPKWRVVTRGAEAYDGSDGAMAEYLMAPPEVYARQKAIENKARDRGAVKAELERMDGLLGSLSSMSVGIDEVSVSASTEASVGTFLDASRDVADRAQARRKRD